MSKRRPRAGKLLRLWEEILPNRGYLAEDIRKIAEDLDLGEHTATNMLNHGTKQEYIFYDKNTGLYYRSDSTSVSAPSPADFQGGEITDLNIISITETIARDIEELKEAIRNKQVLVEEKERLERNLDELNRKIDDLSYLDRFLPHHKK